MFVSTLTLRLATSSLTACFIALVAASSPLSAYMPTRWSPLDVYVLKGRSGGPQKVQVVSKGKVLQSARLTYDAAGRLMRETYDGSSPRRRGSTVYVYSGGRLIGEQVRDSRGQLRSRKRFVYRKGALSGMVVQDGRARVIMRHSYRTRERRIIEGRESNGQAELFAIRYRGERPVLIQITREDGKQIGTIQYRYDARGRIRERLRRANGLVQKCIYKRDGRGRIVSGTYVERRGRKWVKVRTLRFIY